MADPRPPETEGERNRRLGYRPLTLTERQQRLMESRGIARIQPRPAGVAPIPLDIRGREGIPFDVLFALEAIRQQAEQGNAFAKWLYEQECRSLGITPVGRSAPAMPTITIR